MALGSAGYRILAALALLAVVGAAGGYALATRSRPEAVRVELSPDPEEAASSGRIAVHVAGAVRSPGLYHFDGAARVDDAIRAAGGPSEDADLDAVNLAAPLQDGDKVLVPTRGQGGTSGGGGSTSDGRVNLNTATAAELETLPGIGPSLAQRIIAHREQRGPFRDVRDLLKVSGIGPKKFEAIEGLVTV